MNTQNIFVYGLLQSKYDNEAAQMLRKHATLIGPASIPGAVFDLGEYPAVFFEKNMKGMVRGELYYIHGDSNQLLQFLDEFEGIGPDEQKPFEYRRGIVQAQCEGGETPALCYLYNRAITHILNGDGLKHVLEELLAGQIPGEFLTTRECLMDGPVSDSLSNLSAFFTKRSQFLAELDSELPEGRYLEISRSEFDKMRQIPKKSVICLWFERDLFCQVNLWFVAWLLRAYVEEPHVFLVEPGSSSPYSFNALPAQELYEAFEHRHRLTPEQLSLFAKLWECYAQEDTSRLLEIAQRLSSWFPFVSEAVQAHLNRQPIEGSLGRPMESLKTIIGEWEAEHNESPKFGAVFQEFCRREAIYGYGDLQVLRMFEELTNS